MKSTMTVVLSLLCSSATADELITIRPGPGDRLLIEDSTGRDLGTARRLNDRMWVIEDMNGRDRAILHDIEFDCGDDRSALTCILGDDDEDDGD